jgi:hypothetical protein
MLRGNEVRRIEAAKGLGIVRHQRENRGGSGEEFGSFHRKWRGNKGLLSILEW